MMKLLLTWIVFAPMLLKSQINNRIVFENTLTWTQVLLKAKADYKYIFVSATPPQCLECKSLTDELYTNQSIADFMNDEFISVQSGIDSTTINTKALEGLALLDDGFWEQYRSSKIPVFLFFSPDGRLVHRGEGQKSVNNFLLLAQQALDPADQYYTQLNAYKAGKKDYPLIENVILTTLSFGEKRYADSMAMDYKVNYLDRLSDTMLCQTTHMQFVRHFLHLENIKGRIFQLCYKNPELVDKETYDGYADGIVKYLINKEEIEGNLRKANELKKMPQWDSMYQVIERKYNSRYADEIIPSAKLEFYQQTSNWPAYVKEVDGQLKNCPARPGEGPDSDSWKLNLYAWQVFIQSDDPALLKRALAWAELSLRLDPTVVQTMDTKANLLYKLGFRKDAIERQEKTITAATKLAELNGVADITLSISEYVDNLSKMKAGEPTWETK